MLQPYYANRGNKTVWKRKAGVSSSELASRPLTDSGWMWRKGEAVTAGETASSQDTGFWLTYKDQRIRFERSEDGQSWSAAES